MGKKEIKIEKEKKTHQNERGEKHKNDEKEAHNKGNL
jgi:hypothetical protein